MQPYFFPYLGYFQLVHAVDRFVIYDNVAFIKQGWVNRNRILINGQASYITVPLKHASSFRAIADTAIDDSAQNREWAARMLKTIDNAYRRAPEFRRVWPLVESVLGSGATRIGELAVQSLRTVAAHLDLETAFVASSAIDGDALLTAQDRVIAMCRSEGADEYVNAAGGVELYSRDAFAGAGITLRFLESHAPAYQQFGAPFVPALSIIDVLMFNSVERVRALLSQCRLA